jgi:uncharacterized protein (TIGR02266 family)
MSPAEKERRNSARLPIEMWVEEFGPDTQVFRRAGNLSSGGLYLDHTIPIPIGADVTLRFTLPGEDGPVTVSGQIVSINASQALGMGVKFVNVPPDDQKRIDSYLNRALTPVAGTGT